MCTTGFFTEDGLFYMIRARSQATLQTGTKKSMEQTVASTPVSSPQESAISSMQYYNSVLIE